jgi:hypothetical protein
MLDHDCSDLPSLRVSFPGPFTHHDVVVDGWSVPFIKASLSGEDRVRLILDERMGLDLNANEAERLIPFLADAHPRGDGPELPPRMPHNSPRRVVQVEALPG